jgi:hypothetical protein
MSRGGLKRDADRTGTLEGGIGSGEMAAGDGIQACQCRRSGDLVGHVRAQALTRQAGHR